MTTANFWQSCVVVDYGLAIGPCWIWTKAIRNGYGAASMAGKVEDTHRIAYRLTHGSIPEGLSVLHHCDHGLCIRPEHLFSGTQADNIHDMDAKARSNRVGRKGEAHHKAKLTDANITDIRAAYSVRVRGTVKALAAKYGLNRQTINRVALHKAWTHI
jgi:hypothetical protein